MDLHKPKPWHGLREFLKEYAIIVVGVLTALAAEQVAETLHHREIVDRGEAALSDNFAKFVEFRVAAEREAPCVAARAAEVRAILDAAGKTRRLPRIGPIPQPIPLPWQVDTWEATVASGAAPYLPQDKVVLYSRISMSAVDLYAAATHEWDEWHHRRPVWAGPALPSPAEKPRLGPQQRARMGHAATVQFIAKNTVTRIESTHLLRGKALSAISSRGVTLSSRCANP